MKKIKSLLKRILGRPQGRSVTIDIVSPTLGGHCIIGWYFNGDVKQIAIHDSDNNKLESEQQAIDRSDVLAATGKAATGFQLIVKTDKTLDQLVLIATLHEGKFENYPLTAATSTNAQVPIHSTATGSTSGCGEYAVLAENYLFLVGWLLDKGRARDFHLIINGATESNSEQQLLRFHRQDVVKSFGGNELTKNSGIMLLFRLTDDQARKKINKLSLQFNVNDNIETVRVEEITANETSKMVRAKKILNNWQHLNISHRNQADVVAKPLQALYQPSNKVVATRHDFGLVPQTPRASIVIPLYGRFDFIQFQLSHFNRARDVENCEIIYVVDDPSIASKTLTLANKMARMVTLPFSILVLSENVGFGQANNIGVAHARSDNLVLLNSDILPKSNNWLDVMLASLADESIGIVGARLLFEDNAIQHDGMALMTLTEYPELYFNDHPCKGWREDLSPNPAEKAECDLLTAACWAIRKEHFDAVGGFDPCYVLGDFEDSDLCLKLLQQGKKNIIRRDAVLYHLERMSQNLVESGNWKHSVTIINAITYNKRWAQELAKMAQSGDIA